MNNLQIISTEDGSSSILNLSLNETYHSTHGALRESQHVFIDQGVQHFVQLHQPQCLSVFEVGFGTGLNALLAIQFAQSHKIAMEYTTLEAFPIDEEIVSQLNYPTLLGSAPADSYFKKIHEAEWDALYPVTEYFSLQKINASLHTVLLKESSCDVVFYDAFAPSKQPEMWTKEILEKIVLTMKPGALFTTYCAKGQLKRDLKSLGLNVESLPGPPGKREMVRATKVG
ncbi:MAG: tRNA (5-methylaminomethyl-2-thiouridine)(34)-methyltransferase MnmD [Bacteroidetes bacterium]|nr:tRNA (5-methylaminomethyl-2-thiouridine)(34)-methyltransferase MnmD [Bacteroidota bacterium]